jgi:tetratricopeptide (TPR) repeat protein
MSMTPRRVAGIAGVLLLSAGAPVGGQAPAPEAVIRREYPAHDWMLVTQVQHGMKAREADRAWLQAPDSASTFRLLVETNRIDDAIQSLETSTRGSNEQLIAMLGALNEKLSDLQRDASRGYAERVSAIVTPLRSKVASLAREDAARLAWRLMNIERQLRRSADWSVQVRAFVQEYQGTAEALRAAIGIIESDHNYNLATIAPALDAVVKAHPGSETAAQALYLKGFRVGAQTVSGRNADYTDAFLQTVAIVDELESGRYPDCEWVRKAPELIVGFFWPSRSLTVIPPANRDRILGEYQRFARSHFTPEAVRDFGYSLAYLLSSRMPEFFGPGSDRIAGVEKLVADLEAHGADKRALELYRAEFLMREALGGTEVWRAALLPKAEAALTTLAAANADFYSRKAAALNASRLMYQRDYSRALAAYDTYVARYPSSPWTWVARLRAGQCLVELGDLTKAAASFETVAGIGTQEPLAALLGSALAAQTYDALGQYDRSLVAYRRALAEWSNDYQNSNLTPIPSQRSVPAPATGESTMRRAVTQQNLADRVASLERNLKTSVGPLLERAVWQIDARRFTDARTTLAQAANGSTTEADRAATRILDHRAHLEIAMELLAIEGPTADVTGGLKALDSIAPAPFDTNVGFAGLAKATVMFKNGADEHARLRMTSTLDEWRESQRALRGSAPTSPIAADVAAIRNVIFHPAGSFELLAKSSWNAYTVPSSLAYAVINPDVRVTTADGKTNRVTVYQDFPDLTKAVFWTTEDIAFASRLIVTLGGTKRGATTNVMQTPNQPFGAAVDVMNFWNSFFPTRQGHWGGWVVETYPIINNMTFLDEARTRAAVAITVGYSGATVVMEKKNGVWQALRLVNQWIT